MINPFEPIFTKEERKALLLDLEQLNRKLGLLEKGDPDSLRSSFGGLISLIGTFITSEEKDLLAIQAKIQESLTVIQDAVNYTSSSKQIVETCRNDIEIDSAESKRLIGEVSQSSKALNENAIKSADVLNEISANKTSLANVTAEIQELSAKSEIAVQKIQSFEQAIESVEESKNKINLTQKNMRDLLIEVKTLYLEVFGGEEKNEENGETLRIEGLTSKLESAYGNIENELEGLKSQFAQFKKDEQQAYEVISTTWEQEFSGLKSKIESLLPGALSAGLSQAYEEKKNFEIEDIKKSSRTFYIAIAGLTAISIIPVILYICLLVRGEKSLEDIALLAPNVFLAMLPLYVPCLWVAYSSDKKSKLAKRLAEEYAHKSSLSKTFEGISRQVSNLSDNKVSANLESQLLYNLIQVSSENPGKLISDYDKTDHPLYDALDKGIAFSETLEKISFIPGIDKILTRVQRRTQKRIEDLAIEVEDEEVAPLNPVKT